MADEGARTIRVNDDEIGMRLDVLLVGRFGGLGRAGARALLDEGAVRMNGRRVKKGERALRDATIELAKAPKDSRFHAAPDDELALSIVHEDDALVVVDKPAGVPSNPLSEAERGTIANALLARYPTLADVGYSPREPGLVHRLDVETSGLLVAAKTREAFEALRASLAAGSWDKRYRALVAGAIRAPITVDAAIANDPGDARKVRVASDPLEGARLSAREARSVVAPVEALSESTLVDVAASPARRHQVRAHLAFVGHPLVGDALYGGPEDLALGRHFLHASTITLPHPTTGRPVALTSPLAPELEAALARRR